MTQTHTELYRIQPAKTLGWWLLNTFFVFPLSAMIVGIVILPVAYVLSSLFDYNDTVGAITGLAAVPVIGACIGLAMGALQRPILRQRLYWAADNWVRWSMLGGAVGAIVVAIYSMIEANTGVFNLSENEFVLSLMPLFLLVVSCFQTLKLRHAVKQSWLWIIGNVVGGIVFFGVLASNPIDAWNPYYGWLVFGLLILSVVALGLITGMVLLFLFENNLYPMQAEGEVDITEDEKKPASVWDEVV
ncbi:MAG: hypothetical protein AAFQ07_01425 [Chloroflexota bacterium]